MFSLKKKKLYPSFSFQEEKQYAPYGLVQHLENILLQIIWSAVYLNTVSEVENAESLKPPTYQKYKHHQNPTHKIYSSG